MQTPLFDVVPETENVSVWPAVTSTSTGDSAGAVSEPKIPVTEDPLAWPASQTSVAPGTITSARAGIFESVIIAVKAVIAERQYAALKEERSIKFLRGPVPK